VSPVWPTQRAPLLPSHWPSALSRRSTHALL
jgi:hypothetical protein